MKYYLKPSFILLLIFYISANSLKAQHTVTGKVLDDKGKPIDYASVVLQVDGETDVKYDITNEKGKFTVNDVKKGTYKLYVQYFSKDIYTDTIKIAGDLELGNITAKSGFTLLDEVVKTSKKPIIEQKVDRLVFNASSSIAASDGSALDALKKTPMVNVKQDGISLMGKGSVAVLINDRIVRLSGEDLLSYLESVSSVKSIEVITTPPAKYEAEGNSGLINIVLKKGLLNHWSNSTITSYKKATYPSLSIGNTFNYNKDKLSISADINGRKGISLNNENAIMLIPKSKNEQVSYNKMNQVYYSGRLGIDYQLNKSANIGAIFKAWQSFGDNKDSNEVNIKNNKTLTSQIFSEGKTDTKVQNISGNLHYYQKLDNMGKGFSIDLDYFKYENGIDRLLKTSYKNPLQVLTEKPHINNKGDQEIVNYSLKLDIEHPTNWANITYGGKLSYTNTDNNTHSYNTVSGNTISSSKQKDHFKYKENVQSLYFDIAKNIGNKWQLKLGLRYEHTSALGNSAQKGKNKRTYGKLFPTAYVKYYLNEENYFNFSYNRRISRPAFWELNPFEYHINSNISTIGNDNIQPSFTHKIEFKHGWKNKLFSTVYAKFTNNGFGQIPNIDAKNNMQIYTRDNYYNRYDLGLYEAYNFSPFTWWKSSNEFYVFYNKSIIYNKYKATIPASKGTISSKFSTSNSFTLNSKKTILGEADFNYYFPQQDAIWRVEACYSLDIAIKAYFLKRKLTVSLGVNNILKTSDPKVFSYTNDIEQIYKQYYDSRYVKLTLRYSFGNKKIKVKDRKFGNEEENRRAN